MYVYICPRPHRFRAKREHFEKVDVHCMDGERVKLETSGPMRPLRSPGGGNKTRYPISETRLPQPEDRNLRPETRNPEMRCVDPMGGDWAKIQTPGPVPGYLAHKKERPPRTVQNVYS